MNVEMPNGQVVSFPDDTDPNEIKSYVNQKFPEIGQPLYKEGVSADMEDPMGVSTAGMQVPTEYGAKQILRSQAQGATFGMADELEAMVRSMVGDEGYNTEMARINAQMKQFSEQDPTTAMISEVTGGLFNPATYAKIPVLQKFGAGKEAVVRGGVGGFAYGFGKGEGEIEDRVEKGLETAMYSAPFAYGFQKGIQLAGWAGNKTLNMLGRKADRTLKGEDMEKLATNAYKNADLKGSVLTKGGSEQLSDEVEFLIKQDIDYSPDIHKQTAQALKLFKNRANKELTFSGLDNLRQRLWGHYNQASGYERGYILSLINKVDDVVDRVPFKAKELTVARQLYKQTQKVKALEDVVEKAERQASASGSGGNTVNVYLQAVNKLLNNKKMAKFFTPDEIKVMTDFVRSGGGGKLKRAISKLDGSGNGLMLALHMFGATAIDPSMLIVAGVGAGAKKSSEIGVKKGLEEITRTFTGQEKKQMQDARTSGILGTITGQQTEDR